MIINTGQRTDIPAFYSRWFLNRLQEGFVLVGDLKAIPYVLSSTPVGYEVHKYNFYQAVAKVKE